MDASNTMDLEPDYRRLKAAWASGHRDREDALHLLFLAWMHWADPTFVTGMEDDPDADGLWRMIFGYFDGETSNDAEFLHVAGLMAGLFPEGLGDEVEWASRATRMQTRSLDLKPDGFSPEFFEGRSDYGDYFAHQARGSAGRYANVRNGSGADRRLRVESGRNCDGGMDVLGFMAALLKVDG